MHLQYGCKSGCYDVLIVNDIDVWTLVGRHICPLSSTFFVNRKALSGEKTHAGRFK
jgi:hypothetical protein